MLIKKYNTIDLQHRQPVSGKEAVSSFVIKIVSLWPFSVTLVLLLLVISLLAYSGKLKNYLVTQNIDIGLRGDAVG